MTMVMMRKGSNTSQRRHSFIFFFVLVVWDERTYLQRQLTHAERETTHTHTHSQEIDHVLITAAPSRSFYITLVVLARTTCDDYASSEQERLEEDHRPIVSELQREVKKRRKKSRNLYLRRKGRKEARKHGLGLGEKA